MNSGDGHDHSRHEETQPHHPHKEPLAQEAEDKAIHGRDLDASQSEIDHAAHHEHGVPMTGMLHSATMERPVGQHAAHEHESHAQPSAHGGHMAHVDHSGHEDIFRRKFWGSLALSIPVLLFSPMLQMLLGFSLPEFAGSAWVGPVFAVAVFVYGGIPFLQMALPELQNRQPGMMTLISLAIGVAFVYSLAAVLFGIGADFFWELVTLIDIMLLGHWLEMRSVRQASGALGELAKLAPDTAERIGADGETRAVPVSELAVGDRILVRPGSSIPADGVVEEGESDVNEAMITGESRPVKKEAGDRVVTGTINQDGSLRVRVDATGENTTLAGIMRLVAQAQESKSNTQVLADRAAGWLFYIALGVATLTAVGWILAVGWQIQVLERTVTVLVTACPHALGLAIPLVVAITTALGARSGVLIRDRGALETIREVDMVVFDKTGTLTRGEQGLAGMAAAEGVDEDQALGLAAAVEGDSEHIIAKALRDAADQRGLERQPASRFEALKGRGVKADVDGQEMYVGSPGLLAEMNLELPGPLREFTLAAGEKGQTVVYLVGQNQARAAFALADVVRPESKEAVRRLKEMGVEVAMLTGDSRAVAEATARELGIQTFFAEVLPEHKDQKVSQLKSQGRRVAMVGDGVNDAPALTRADVGIAIGSGTDVAVEAAGIVLVKSNPLDVVRVIRLGRASYRKMVQNLIWATGYNLFALPLAAGVLAPVGIVLSPAAGALLMSISTIVVALNAQLLRRVDLN